MTAAILYARFSPRPTRCAACGAQRTSNSACPACGNATDDKEVESIALQFERLQDYCKASGWAVLATYRDPATDTDKGMSGASDELPQRQLAIDHAIREKAILVVYSLSRLSRGSASTVLAIADHLQSSGADLASLKERIDTTTPIGRFVVTIFAGLNRFEREQTAERTSDAIRRKMANGFRHNAPAGRAKPFGLVGKNYSCLPYGKCVDPFNDKRMIDDRRELQTLELIRQLRASGMSLAKIAAYLNKYDVPSRGQCWHKTQIARLTKDIKPQDKRVV